MTGGSGLPVERVPAAPGGIPGDPPWRDWWRAAFDRHGHGSLAQIATVSPDGAPEVRTVVLRGLTADGCPFTTTDVRSEKVRAVRAGSELAACVWWKDPGVQVRLRGPAAVVVGDHAWAEVRSALWSAHRDIERSGFAGPPPGTPIERAPRPSPPPEPPEAFALLVAIPHRFERLSLGDPHERFRWGWRERGGWTGGRIAP